jgi:hypothetical protein
MHDNDVPDSGDPSWEERCIPLHGFLAEPRTWRQIKDWAFALPQRLGVNVLQNMLAWLSLHRRVRFCGGLWYGVALEAALAEEAELERMRELEYLEMPTSRPGIGQAGTDGGRRAQPFPRSE